MPERLKRRADFKAVANGVRIRRPAFTLQARTRCDAAAAPFVGARVGFTVTKKVGNAVVRNRIRRRLKAAADALHDEFRAATDYVVVARREALTAPFDTLGAELAGALAQAHDKLHRPAVHKRA